MHRFFIVMVVALLFSAVAIAEPDLSSMSSDDLVALRQHIDTELANRIQADATAQTVTVDGLVFKLEQVLIGTGRDDAPAIAIVFRVSNTSDSSKSMTNDISYNILQDGANLESTFFNSDEYQGISAVDTMFAKIKPGAVDMQLCVAGILNGDSGRIEVDLFRRQAPRDEDPYCGTFVVDLSELQ